MLAEGKIKHPQYDIEFALLTFDLYKTLDKPTQAFKTLDKAIKDGKGVNHKIWKKLSKKQRETVIEGKKKKKKELPSQYDGFQTNNTRIVGPDGATYEWVSIVEDQTSMPTLDITMPKTVNNATQVRFVEGTKNGGSVSQSVGTKSINAARAQMMLRQVANMQQFRLSGKVSKRMSLQSCQTDAATGELIIDGGTNVSMMGCTFRTILNSGRLCDMHGFDSEVTKKSVPIQSGVSTVTLAETGKKFLLGLHEAPYLPNNRHSLLSTGQCRENGIWCDDML